MPLKNRLLKPMGSPTVKMSKAEFQSACADSPQRISIRLSLCAIILLGALLLNGSPASAAGGNIYISQNGGGAGTSCADTLSAAWFNSSANWGNGGNQIGPGTTV